MIIVYTKTNCGTQFQNKSVTTADSYITNTLQFAVWTTKITRCSARGTPKTFYDKNGKFGKPLTHTYYLNLNEIHKHLAAEVLIDYTENKGRRSKRGLQ